MGLDIGELFDTSRAAVRQAVEKQDAQYMQEIAKPQEKSGAGYPTDEKVREYVKADGVYVNAQEAAKTCFPDIVAEHIDIMIHKIERFISAIPLQADEAAILKTSSDYPALCISQMVYAREEKPLGLSRTIYRGDTFGLKTVSYPYSRV
jgi:hypothetical protein